MLVCGRFEEDCGRGLVGLGDSSIGAAKDLGFDSF